MTREDHEAGFTLTEVVIASMVFSILVTMTFFTATQIVRLAVRGTAKGTTAETAQSRMATLEQYLQDAVSPTSAAAEYQAAGVTSPAPCSGAASSGTAVQSFSDYQLELCTAPPRSATCTQANVDQVGSGCPQLYSISVDPSQCSSSNQCTLEIEDMSVAGTPVVWENSAFRCPSHCQADAKTSGELALGSPPSFPYLFTYYSVSGGNLTELTPDSTPSTWLPSNVGYITLDVETAATSTAASSQPIYTELRDSAWILPSSFST